MWSHKQQEDQAKAIDDLYLVSKDRALDIRRDNLINKAIQEKTHYSADVKTRTAKQFKEISLLSER